MMPTAIQSSCPQTEWSHEFIKGMLARMEVSYHKYGKVADAYPHRIDALKSMQERLKLYLQGDEHKGIEPGNTEWLIDAANFLMIEFMHPSLPGAEFAPSDANLSPGRVFYGTKARHLDNDGERLLP